MEGKENTSKKNWRSQRETLSVSTATRRDTIHQIVPTVLCSAWRDHHTCHIRVTIHRFVEKPAVAKTGSVEGTAVSNILLDTGCSRTLVRKDLVPKEKRLEATFSLVVLLG